jgi:hypothetical protein
MTSINIGVEHEKRETELERDSGVVQEAVEIKDAGAASDKTKGFFGPRVEFGSPPFNGHP